MASELQSIVDGTTIERVLLDGDLGKLPASQRVAYYGKVCETLGLNPLTRPFEYILLNNKLTLYAKRECTEQLRRIHKVSLKIVSRELVEGTYIVTCRATLPDGRTDESIGAKWLGDLKGETRANAIMTSETKSKRRVTLSICGLGLLDETEVDDIPEPARMGTYDTVAAPPPPALDPPAPDPEPPEGFVRIMKISSSPTKNPQVTKYFITLSTGEELTTINSWLASLAQDYCEQKTPVKVKSKKTKWGADLVALMTEDERPAEPLPLDDEIPF